MRIHRISRGQTIAIAISLLSQACASLQGKGALDQSVIRDLVCSGRESEAKQYILARNYGYADYLERTEWARKECR